MNDEVARRKVLEFLRVGAATADALRGFLGRDVHGPQYERVMSGLELEGLIERGRWGDLPVWKQKKMMKDEG